MSPRAATKRPKIAPRRPQDGLMSVLFSLRFLHRFLVRFWCHIGSLVAPKMEPSWLKNRDKHDHKKWCYSRAAKMGPRAPQEHPKRAKKAAQRTQFCMFSEFSRLKTWFCSILCVWAEDFPKSCSLRTLFVEEVKKATKQSEARHICSFFITLKQQRAAKRSKPKKATISEAKHSKAKHSKSKHSKA